MLFENIINHIILLFFFSAAYSLGRLVFNNFLLAIAFGISILSFVIYKIFLIFGINLFTVISIFATLLIFLIIFAIINRRKNPVFKIRTQVSLFYFSKLFSPEFIILIFLLGLYLTRCVFPIADEDSMNQYLYLPKLYLSKGDFSAGNFLPHGRESLWYPSLIAFLSYFCTLDISAIFNFYLILLLIGTLYGMCLSIHIQDKINFNSFCLISCIFLANPLMNYIISTGRPYIFIGYFCTTLLYFVLLNFDKRHSDNLYVLFVGVVGGALVSINHLGLAIFGFFFIALLIANYNRQNTCLRLIFVSGILAFVYSLSFYVRTYFMGHLFYPFTPECKIPINEFTGLLAPIKAIFIISTRNCQGGCSSYIGILYFSFFPIILYYFIIKRHLLNIRLLLFLFVFILLYYFVWLSKIPQARSLIGIFPPYLLLLYMLVDLKKPLYKYAIYLFSVLMIAYSVLQLGRFGYVNYLLGKQTKVDFVYSVLNKWGSNKIFYDEPNEIVAYIISNFRNYDVVFCDGVFPLTLLPNKVFRLGSERQKHNAILLCPNTTPQTFKPLKRFESYTIYAYQ